MPKRSATAPANGWPMPQSRFCSAKASANTSRPQPFAWDMGVRKKPNAERGPKPSSEIRQPQRMITSGVRQPIERAAAEICVIEVRPSDSGPVQRRRYRRAIALTNIGDPIDQIFLNKARTSASDLGTGNPRKHVLYQI